jgi:two-component system NtrC family sensor kinase
MALAVCLGAAAILLAAGAWNLRLQRAQLTGLVSLSADRIAETIRSATRDGMMRDDQAAVHRTIQNIGAQPGIARIRILNKDGRIRTSTEAAEVGTLVNIGAEQCYACHQKDRPLDRLERADRVRIFRGSDGQRILGIIAPIHNEPQCATACHAHPATQRVLGVLDVQLSMASVDQALRSSERQMSLGLSVTVVAVLLLAGLLVWRMVLGPVERLTAAMARVTSGDLGTRVPVTSSDEIGEMAESWNEMTAELGRARGELQELNQTLEQRVEGKTRELEVAHRRMLIGEKMASLGKLAAVVAHEINNPLAGIRTYARLLRRRLGGLPEGGAAPTADAETDRILQTVEEEAGRCGDIVRNMLVFSRTSGGPFVEEDLAPVLERCRVLLRHQAEMLGVTLTVSAASDLPRLDCDRSQMEQVVLALAMNALEATPPGGEVTITAGPGNGGTSVILSVADTGCGIPEEDQGRIFEPFFTTKPAGKGVGLGLAVVYGIVTRHQGRIQVASKTGSGTVFTVELPRRPPGEPSEGEGRET